MRTTTSDLLLALALTGCGAAPVAEARPDAECATCHAGHAAAFATSAHARAAESELFRALAARADAPTRSFCDRCHAPHKAPGERGVGCVTCHAAVGTRGVSNGRLVAGDPDVMLGGFDAIPTAAHGSRRAAFTRSADLCGACHEVAGPGALVETPYSEWSRSPAAAVGVTCADCHMASTPGTSAARPQEPAATGGPPRPLSDHAFVGPEHPRAGELLGRAAAIELAVHGRDAASIDVAVTVVNRNSAHALPSGARFAREVWVEVAAVDARGGRHVVTGGLDADGAPLREDARIELGDPAVAHRGGVPVLGADGPTDRSIPAAGRRSWAVRVSAVWDGAATTAVTARLRYRRNAWALRAALGLAPDRAPPVDLAQAELSLAP
ncbi:MAG: hypothetical protein U0324_23885 [Polyangiales bacterium]